MPSRYVRGDRYSHGAIAFHWVIAALVLFNIVLGLFHESLLKNWQVIPLHKTIGITVLALTLGRIAWRFTHQPPHLPEAMPGWEKLAAKGGHFLLYALLLLLPLTGWLLTSDPARPHPIHWFGLFDVPLLPVAHPAAQLGRSTHGPLGYLMTALVLLHIAAALRHHFLLRDRVLVRMLPGARSPR